MSAELKYGDMAQIWSDFPVPDGWVLCDGANGTPDLRERPLGKSYSVEWVMYVGTGSALLKGEKEKGCVLD